jgi:hypothetical protein
MNVHILYQTCYSVNNVILNFELQDKKYLVLY